MMHRLRQLGLALVVLLPALAVRPCVAGEAPRAVAAAAGQMLYEVVWVGRSGDLLVRASAPQLGARSTVWRVSSSRAAAGATVVLRGFVHRLTRCGSDGFAYVDQGPPGGDFFVGGALAFHAEGGQARRLSPEGENGSPVCSPSGGVIAFVHTLTLAEIRGETCPGEAGKVEADKLLEPGIWATDLRSGNVWQVSRPGAGRPGGGEVDITGAWSPDGRYLAFVRVNVPPPRTVDLWVAARDGSSSTRLTHTGDVARQPIAWTADGQRVLYAREAAPAAGGAVTLWSAWMAGGEPQQVLSAADLGQASAENTLVVAPDGARVAVLHAARAGRPRELVVVDTRSRQAVTVARGDLHYPTWSPDGRSLAYVRYPSQVWVVPVSAEREARLVWDLSAAR